MRRARAEAPRVRETLEVLAFTGPAGMVSVHPSVRRGVVAELPAAARERRVLCLLDAVAAVSPGDPWRPERWPAHRRALIHARTAADHGRRMGLRSLVLAAVLSDLGGYE